MDFNYYFYYEDGCLYWKNPQSNRNKKGQLAGYKGARGYLRVKVGSKHYQLHRVIFSMLKGEIPQGMQVDHIDRNKLNNRIENLRLATNQQNNYNRGARKDSLSGFKGVYWSNTKNKWYSQIRVNGKFSHLGTFEILEEAVAAYNIAAQELHGEFFYA
jgi:hypothetical protein